MPLLAGAKAIHKYIHIVVWKRVAGEPVASNGLSFELETKTPLWAGGVGASCDRLHETGIMGSLRWWYEALVRGLGGYACDPSNSKERCRLTGKEKREEIKSKLCPACYLFGAGGWKRLFNLRVEGEVNTPIHFRTELPTNRYRLNQIFGGEGKTIDDKNVAFGDLNIKAAFRRDKDSNKFGRVQFTALINFIARYGGIGAKLQHGFGQVSCKQPQDFKQAFSELSEMIGGGEFRRGDNKALADIREFVCITYELPKDKLKGFLEERTHVGSNQKRNEERYIPCVFDIRYKGEGKIGFRNWLEKNRYPHKKINRLLGNSGKIVEMEGRSASRVMMGMPYQDGDSYLLKVFAFPPEDTFSPEEFVDICGKYMREAFGVEGKIAYGTHILKKLKG